MHDGVELTGLALVGLIALAGGLLMVRMRQPVIVGYIVAGVVLGPSGFQLVEDRLSVAVLAELGVLMLLFLVGMELSLRGFKAIWKVAVGATLLQIAIAVGHHAADRLDLRLARRRLPSCWASSSPCRARRSSSRCSNSSTCCASRSAS